MKRILFAMMLLACVFSAQARIEWLALEEAGPTIIPGKHGGNHEVTIYRMPQFRRELNLTKKVKKASAKVCGLGHFDLFLNGKKVGDHFLDPGWTCYDKEALYVDFDLTKLLRKGENTIDVMLGSGFFTVPNQRYAKLICSYGQPRLWMQLVLTYADGTQETIGTETENWKVCESPITYSSIYGGETYDARKVESLKWQKPISVPSHIRLIPQSGTELKVRCEVKEKRHYLNKDGYWMYDLGQNFSGIVRMTVKGTRGSEVQLWPAELLTKEGDIQQAPVGAPYHWDYILKGDSKGETWQPQFTYCGQRYVRVQGAVPQGEDNPKGLPVITSLVGLHTCTAAPEVGSFECGDTLFNQIHNLIDWAIRSNSQSVFTDCPHREKLGWMEQDYLMQNSIQYRYNVLPIYRKVFCDMESSQWENGCIPTIAPMYVMFADGFEDTPEWGVAFIVCPWQAYKWYGDRTLIQEHYPAMKRYIDYLSSRANNNIVAYGLGDWFDIGPKAPGYAQLTHNGMTASSVYFYSVTLMQKMASLLGKDEDAREYAKLAEEIRAAINREFYHPEGYYDMNSQTANAMALFMGIVEEENRAKVLESLIGDLRNRNYALTAGDIGYRFVLQALEEAGRSDVVYKMNRRNDVPGYGWQLAHGATSLTESWQAYDNVSNNHLMLGHLMEWLYGGMCGIRQTEESIGFQHLLFAPEIIAEIGQAKGSLQTKYGLVSSEWKLKSDGTLQYKVQVPKGCDAHVYIPAYHIDTTVSAGTHKFTGKK